MTLDASTDAPPEWALVLPLKGGPAAKSRLGSGRRLAHAIAMDCLDAALGCRDVGTVLVVTADPGTAAEAGAAGAVVVAETRPGAGLVEAVRDALAALPAAAAPTAVLLGDLPALRPADLGAGLRAVGGALHPASRARMAAVPDAEGSGTVLLAARSAADLDPAFGRDSLAAHRRRGAVVVLPDLGRDGDRLRRDVDTPADLRVALALGVGPRTAALIGGARSAS